ncbi:MAG: orotidine-5'-phosphate decarboxylase [Phycisphaeraceae bacterium]|nr:MAG: orotidine-5'-phosphate decarboxylase [Phycisphaeraceae bacterium]
MSPDTPASTSPHFADRLLRAAERAGSPACVGLDPVLDWLPDDQRTHASTPARAIEAFSLRVLDAVAGAIGVVKPQSACFERYGAEGVAALGRVIQAARERELVVILDAKRGDIGLTAEHYAAATFQTEPGLDADAVTVNAFLGMDTLAPYLDADWAVSVAPDEPGGARGRGIFVLVRTSNPGSDAIQSQRLDDGRTVAEMLADETAKLGESRRGERGYSSVGAVVAATKPQDAAAMRGRMPHQIFLVPGYGAQGGTAETVRELFHPPQKGEAMPTGAVVTASRSIIFPLVPEGMDWAGAVRDAASRFAEEVRGAMG